MTAAITDRDEAAGVTQHRYHYTRVVETAGHIVCLRVTRDFYPSSASPSPKSSLTT